MIVFFVNSNTTSYPTGKGLYRVVPTTKLYTHWSCWMYWLVHVIIKVWCISYHEQCVNYFKDDTDHIFRVCVAQCVERLIRNVEVVCLSPIKGPCCFIEQEHLPLWLSTGWFQERIRAWFLNRTKINGGPYGRVT